MQTMKCIGGCGRDCPAYPELNPDVGGLEGFIATKLPMPAAVKCAECCAKEDALKQENKFMTPDQEKALKVAKELEKTLVDAGKIIEGGWAGFRLMAYPSDISQRQFDDLRNTLFAGAHHLFTSIMNLLEPGDEPTANDYRRLTLIHTELDEFIKNFEAKHLVTKGTA